MTTFAVSADSLLDGLIDGTDDFHDLLPRSVANPRRTTWTGYAKADHDRLPAS
jgi:hypothetical protein